MKETIKEYLNDVVRALVSCLKGKGKGEKMSTEDIEEMDIIGAFYIPNKKYFEKKDD